MIRGGWLLTGAVLLAGFVGCQTERAREADDGVHEGGFADPESPGFHGHVLRAEGYPLGACRVCHGDDYGGGRVGSSCLTSGCHTEGVESCGTCHDAEPTSGAHLAHAAALDCTSCHPVPDDARQPSHPDGTIDVAQTGLAAAGGATPRWDPTTRTCADVYCHGGEARRWDEAGPLGCGGCHGAPPASHARFADAESDCTACHGDVAHHLDGRLDLEEPACASCHGAGPLGAPPPGLLGEAQGGAVGAHARHLDPSLEGRIGRVVACESCHVVPTTMDDPGHLDASAPADVAIEGTYDAETRSCVVGCHGDDAPGPRWDDDSGAARACDACHGMPPATTVAGSAHPHSAPDPDACTSCHTFEVDTHVDGEVDVRPLGCDGCHGTGPLGAPPPGLDGELDGPGVGAHVRHLDPTLVDRIGRVARCTDCHRVPDAIDDPGHVDAAPPADVDLRFGGAYAPADQTCVTGCHWDRDPGPTWTDDSGAARACDACHAMPPAKTRIGTPHPPSAPELGVCLGCHTFDPTTHVDGQVDFAQ